MNKAESKIFELYKQWITDSNCKNCQKHDINLDPSRDRVGPISFFHAGKNMTNDNQSPRIAFVGKASRNSKEDVEGMQKINNVIDLSDFGRDTYNEEYKSQYWNFIKKITKDLNLSLDDIAITNLVKCNIYDNKTNTSRNITPPFYYEQCIKLFEKEIIALQPTHIVLFTRWGYDYLLEDLTFGYSVFKDIRDEDYKKKIKKDKGYFSPAWWHRNFGDEKMHMLRTRHPERCPLPLVDAIVEWVKSTKQSQ